MDQQQILMLVGLIALGVLALGAVAFAFLSPQLAGSGKAQKRIDTVVSSKAKGAARLKELTGADNSAQRRKQVQETLKELEAKQKERRDRVTLRSRIEQAGLDFSPRTFYIISFVVAVVTAGGVVFAGQPIYAAGLAAVATGLGLPRWVLNFLKNRRENLFLEEFANSIDVIVRGVKSGLPLNDCLKVIATEAPDPVGSEFRLLIEGQRIGVPLDEGLQKMFERTPLPEVNFFSIVLAIQSKVGGNLSEALGNLAHVLRDRKRMKGKIQAMSSEAKASAGIIGSLPPFVMLMITFMSPDFMTPLFTERFGNLLLIGSGCWMFLGVLVMRKMINFKF